MTNKLKVFKFHCHGQFAPAYACNKPGDNSGEYVSLSDYEALQTECEKLRKALREAEHFLTQIDPVHWPSKREARRIIGIVRVALASPPVGHQPKASAGAGSDETGAVLDTTMTAAAMKRVANELAAAAANMSDEEDDFELGLRVYPPGIVAEDDDGTPSKHPVLAVFDAEYPEEGIYPVYLSGEQQPSLASPAAEPAGRIPLDPRTGQPLITSEMKKQCIGEFSFTKEETCFPCYMDVPDNECDRCGGEQLYMETHEVPWTTCKEIYKAMATAAIKAQPAPTPAPSLSPEVLAFAHLMQAKLDQNTHKDGNGKRGWKGCTLPWLFARLLDEVQELQDAIQSGQEIEREAADVGNMAMMIADVAGGSATNQNNREGQS